MLKKDTIGNFNYVRLHFNGLKTTIVNYKTDGGEQICYEIRKEYMCLNCKEEKELIVFKNGVTSERQTAFFQKCVSEVLCPACYCGTDQAVEGAAESLMALLN